VSELHAKPVAVVTGGAGEIGTAIVAALATSHRTVVLDQAGPRPVELGDEVATRAAARDVLSSYGRCDVIVHAAAAFDRASLADLDAGTWRRVQAVNVESVIWLCQELVPAMVEARFGRVILVVSDTIWKPPRADMLPYVVSKAALVGLCRSLAVELGPHNITVNCVAPGLTATATSRERLPTEFFERVERQQALPRSLQPEDVSGVVAFLASDAAGALTGQTLCTDGGLVFR
jgi:pyridoxal 4-dehydrogenase